MGDLSHNVSLLFLTVLLFASQSSGQITTCPTNCVCEYGDHDQQLLVTCDKLVAMLDAPLPTGFDQALIKFNSGSIDAIPEGYFVNVAKKTLTLEIRNTRIGNLERDLVDARGLTLRVTIENGHINTIRERAFVVGRIDHIIFKQITIGTVDKRAFDADTIGKVQWENTHLEILKKHAITTDSVEYMKMYRSSIQMMEHYALQDIDVDVLELDMVRVENDTPFTGLERIGALQMYNSNFIILRHETIPSQFPWNEPSIMIHNNLDVIQEGTLQDYNILMEERDVCDNRVYCDDRVFWMFESGRNTLPGPVFKSLICHAENLSDPRKAILHTCSLVNRELVGCEYIPAGESVYCQGESQRQTGTTRQTPRGSTPRGSGATHITAAASGFITALTLSLLLL